jgi:predicted molibdopterin-dependent oxidoreductase YjgC
MAKVKLTINGKPVEAAKGEKILWAALDNGIYIPHLCEDRGRKEAAASCRLCFVEVEGKQNLVLGCVEPVFEGMVVNTRSERVLRLVKVGFRLLISTHPVECAECPGNDACALQEIAKKMKFGLNSGRLKKILPNYPIDESHPDFGFDANRCVLCGKCVHECNEVTGAEAINFIRRGIKTKVGTFDDGPIAESSCVSCFNCVEVCPVKAFYYKK